MSCLGGLSGRTNTHSWGLPAPTPFCCSGSFWASHPSQIHFVAHCYLFWLFWHTGKSLLCGNHCSCITCKFWVMVFSSLTPPFSHHALLSLSAHIYLEMGHSGQQLPWCFGEELQVDISALNRAILKGASPGNFIDWPVWCELLQCWSLSFWTRPVTLWLSWSRSEYSWHFYLWEWVEVKRKMNYFSTGWTVAKAAQVFVLFVCISIALGCFKILHLFNSV